MKYEFIGKGKTREEASAAAKAGLTALLSKEGIANPNEAYFHEELIAMPKKKILGLFGGSDAEVKFCYDDGKKAKKPAQKKQAKPQSAKKEAPAKAEAKSAPKKAQPKKEAAPVAERAPMERNEEEKITENDIDMETTLAYVSEMLKGLNVEGANVSGAVVDGVLEITVDTEDCGIIIGRRGETLDAIQYLTSLIAKKKSGKYVRVVLNVADYREKRTEAVRALARKNAEYVLRTGRRHTFEPMNPFERRLIHTTIQEIDGVESVSIGYGADRRVVIQPEGGVKYQSRDRGYSRRSSSAPAKKAAPAPKDFTKFGKIEVNKED